MFSDPVPVSEISTTSVSESLSEKIFGDTEDLLLVVIPILLGITIGLLSTIDFEEIKVVKFIKKKFTGKD
jgi:hypothetical protein